MAVCNHLIYMKKFRKLLRLFWLVIFIVLGSVGVGLGGGVPIPLTGRKRNIVEVQTELPEPENDKAKTTGFKRKE